MPATSGAVRAGRAFVETFADNSRLGRDLRQGVAIVKNFARDVRAIGQTLFRSGLTIAAPIAIAATIYAGFADQMAEVKAVSGASESAFAALNEQAKELGRTTSFTAGQVGSLQTELGRAGFNPSEILASTQAVLNLSRATRTELSQGAQIAADSLRSFRLEASAMPAVADVLTATVNSSSQTLVDLFEALKTVGPAAADVGQSIRQTAAAIGVLANNGIKGTLAGTALRRAYLNLANDSIRNKLKELTGISAVDSAGNLRPLADVITEIGQATKNLPNADRLSIFAEIFGDRAVVAASSFASSSANFDRLLTGLENSAGTAARTARIMDDTLGGSFRMLKSAAEGVAIAVGEALEPELIKLANSAATVAGKVTEFVSENRELVVIMASGAAGVAVAGGALVTLGTTLGVASFALSAFRITAVKSLGIIPALLGAIRSPARLATAALLGLAGVKYLKGGPIEGPKIKPPDAVEGPSIEGLNPVAADKLPEAAQQMVDQQIMPADVPAVENQEVEINVADQTSGELSGIGTSAKSAGSEVLSLIGTFAGISVAQSAVKVLGKSLRLIPTGFKLAKGSIGPFLGGLKGLAVGAFKAITSFKGMGAAIVGLVSSPGAIVATIAGGVAVAATAAIASSSRVRGELGGLVGSAVSTFKAIGRQADSAWSQIKSTATTSFSAITNALKSGNIEGAFNIVMASVKAVWTQTVASFAPTWARIATTIERVWNETSKVLGSTFSTAIDTVKETAQTFIKWFNGEDGMRKMNLTFNDVVGGMADSYARAMAAMESMTVKAGGAAQETQHAGQDLASSYSAGMKKATHSTIASFRRGLTRIHGLFDWSIDVDEEIKNINREEQATHEAINDERNRDVLGRMQERDKDGSEREQELKSIADGLKGTLAEIAAETARRNAEDAKAAEEAEKAALAAAEAAKAALEATIQAEGAALPGPKQVDEKPGPAPDPKTGKSPFDLLNEWKQARDKRDELKAELSGANRNQGINPETGRHADEIKAEFNVAHAQAELAMASMERARLAQENNQKFQQEKASFIASIALPSSKGALTTAEADKVFGGTKKKFVQNGQGDSADPETGKTIQQLLAEARTPDLSPSDREKARGARDGLDRMEQRFSGSSGTFSGRAASQLGGSTNLVSRMAKGIEDSVNIAKQTAANTKATVDKIDSIVMEND